METVHSIIGQTEGGYLTRCSFYVPTKEGRSPKPARINAGKAQQLVPGIVGGLVSAREAERSKYEPLDANAIEVVLSILVAFGDIRPRGSAVIAYKNPNRAETTAGQVDPTLRLAYIGPPHKGSVDVLIHELTHLSGVGEVDDLSVLLDPVTLEPQSIRCLSSAWTRAVSAPVDYKNGRWSWNDTAFILKGHFFEEAMAQLVELRALTVAEPILDEPVVFQGGELTFELPVQYGHCAVGWSMLMLDRECPGIVQALIAGARGNADYSRLEAIIERRFPGLFRQLYDITPGTELVVGVEHVLKSLAANWG